MGRNGVKKTVEVLKGWPSPLTEGVAKPDNDALFCQCCRCRGQGHSEWRTLCRGASSTGPAVLHPRWCNWGQTCQRCQRGWLTESRQTNSWTLWSYCRHEGSPNLSVRTWAATLRWYRLPSWPVPGRLFQTLGHGCSASCFMRLPFCRPGLREQQN